MFEFNSEEFRSPDEAAAAAEFELENTVEKEKTQPFDAVIVLGHGIDKPQYERFWERYKEEDQSPSGVQLTEKSPGLMLDIDARMRTVAAAEMYLKGLVREIIFTGGKTKEGIDESEAEKMRDYAAYLLERGGKDSEEITHAILLEDKATNTIENIANVCNIIDQKPEQYQHLAILTNGYHLDRSQELIRKFNLQAEGFKAEDLLIDRSSKYQQVVDKFFTSKEYQNKLADERRYSKALSELPPYWYPQAFALDNPERTDYILKSLGLEQIADKVGKDNLIKFAREMKRVPPPEDWGIEK